MVLATRCSHYEFIYAQNHFPYQILEIKEGLKYLGFRLKPNDYKSADWMWLVEKIESRINVWYHRWFSRVG